MNSRAHSLIRLPADPKARKDAWKQLLVEGKLFEHLLQCVRRPADDGEFQTILADLDAWDAVQQTAVANQNAPFILPGYEHQAQVARTFIKLAQLAARQPNLPIGKLQTQIGAAALDATAAWDAYCALAGNARTALPGTQSRLTVLLEQDQVGCLAILETELMAGGTGCVYPAPAVNASLAFDQETFLIGARKVWELAQREAAQTAEQRQRLAAVDVRFRLASVPVQNYRNPQLSSVSGRSAEAAFFLCLKQSADAYLGQPAALLLDETVAATATIESNGRLGKVGSIPSKLEAAYLAGRAVVIVAAANETEAQLALQNAKGRHTDYPVKTEAVGIETVQGLLEFVRDRAKEREAVRRFEQEKCAKLEVIGREDVGLETHYRELPLLREVKRDKLPRADHERDKPDRRPDEDDPFATPRVIELRRWEESLQQDFIADKQFSLDEVLTDFRKAVEGASSDVPRFFVLGPPGSGKTTLAQYLAWRAAHHKLTVRGRQLIPARVSLRLWELSCAEAKRSLPEYLAERYRSETLPYLPTADHWRDWLRRGEVVLLLDGLDEINGHPQFLETLTETLTDYHDCPTLITCRTVNFDQHRKLTPDFPVFVLGALNTEQRDLSIRAYAAGRSFDAAALIAQLNRAPQMHALETNPLLHALLCFAVDEPNGVKLPARRSELYDKTIEKLLTRPKRVPIAYPNDMPLTDKRRILERAALTLFANPDPQRQLTFDETSLLDALKDAARQEGYGEAPAPYVNALLADLLHNSGMLRGDPERGYFFLHLTFQEHLAAGAIARLVNEQGWEARFNFSGSSVTLRQLVNSKAWDPRWREVTTFLAGQLKHPAPLLEMLADKEQDDYFRHRLALACQCLPELNLAARASYSDIVESITTAAFALWWQHQMNGTRGAVPHLNRALPALGQVNAHVRSGALTLKQPALPLLDLVSELLRDAEWDVRRAAAHAVGNFGAAAAAEPFLTALATLLRDADGGVRWAATDAVGQLGAAAATEPILAALAALLRDAEGDVRRAAEEAVGQLGAAAATEPFLAALAALLCDAEGDVRRAAAEAVGQLGAAAATEPILAALAALLRDAEGDVRSAAAWAVGRLGAAAATESSLAALAALLRDAEGNVRWAAAHAVGQLGAAAATEPILAALAALLRDAERNVRRAAAAAVGQLGAAAATESFLAALAALLRDADRDALGAATEAVWRLGAAAATEPFLAALAALLRDAEGDVRGAAAHAVRRLGAAAATEPFLAALAALSRDAEWDVRRIAAEALAQLMAQGVRVIEVRPGEFEKKSVKELSQLKNSDDGSVDRS